MSTYGASFVRAAHDRTTLEQLSQLLGDMRPKVARAVRVSDTSDWITIESPLDDAALEAVSRELATTVIMIYMVDEIRLRFSYRRFDRGAAIRTLEFFDDGNPDAQGAWTRADGDAEQWEAEVFSPNTIERGAALPQPCRPETIVEIVRRLELPWQPNRPEPTRPWWRLWG